MTKTFSIGECFSVGWAKFKQHTWFLVGMMFGVYALMFIFAVLVEDVFYGIEPTQSVIDFISNIVLYWLCFGMTVIVLKIIDQKPYAWTNIFIIDKQVVWYLVGSFLYGLMVAVGLLFLVIPGIYLAIRYGFFWYAIVDGRKGVIESFKESTRITDGVKWNLMLFAFASVGVILLGVLCFGIGLLVAAPVVMLATAHLYRVLLVQSVVMPQTMETLPETPSQPKPVAGIPTASSSAAAVPLPEQSSLTNSNT